MKIVYTDLDGTLLDALTYEWHRAKPAVQSIQNANIPLIFCSAKTRAEQEPIRQALDVRDPFIVENGSAVIYPDSASVVLGKTQADILSLLDKIRHETGLSFTGYAQMSDQQVADITGLSLESAKRARQRDYSETIVTSFTPQQADQFQKACAKYGLNCPSGGRFRTITHQGVDKGQAIQHLNQHYQVNARIKTYAIGDSPNDEAMFRRVDHAFLVQRSGDYWHDLHVPDLRRIPLVGQDGFIEAIAMILRD